MTGSALSRPCRKNVHRVPRFLLLMAALSGICSSAAAAQPSAIEWIGALPRRPASDELIVITTFPGGERKLSLRSAKEQQAQLPPLPLFSNLLGQASVDAFGSDGRCAAKQEGAKLRLRCRQGRTAAGLVLAFDQFRLPTGAALNLRVSLTGSGGFQAQLTAKGKDADALRPLTASASNLPLPALPKDVRPQLVILAPAEGGDLLLDAVELVPAEPTRTHERAAWAWELGIWRAAPGQLIASARARNITRLFVSLEMDGDRLRHARELGRFVRLARRQGIAVEGVEGDPNMVYPSGLRAALPRARAFARYQKEARAEERLAGLQYDVEPYTLPGWDRDPLTYEGWADAILQLAEAAGEPIDLVLPFWIAGEEGGRKFLDKTAGATRGLTIMSYRTEASLLSQIAEPLLAWGSRRGKPIRLALEAGNLADETEQLFAPGPAGAVAVLQGDEPRAMLLDKPDTIPSATMYALHRQTAIPAARISFLGNEAAMIALADRSAPAFSAWPAFSGFALHGMKWPALVNSNGKNGDAR